MSSFNAFVVAVFAIAIVCLAQQFSSPAGAQNASCQQSCRAQHSQCRISTKGSSSCDAALHSCLQSCIPKR